MALSYLASVGSGDDFASSSSSSSAAPAAAAAADGGGGGAFFDESALDEAAGVGVVVSDAQIEEAVNALVSENEAALVEQRYRFPAVLLVKKANEALRWAEGATVKSCVDSAVLRLLGPKTKEDEEAATVKVTAAPKVSAAAAAALTPTLATAQALLERLPAHRQLRGELDAVLCRLLQAGLAPHYRVFLPWASHHGQAGSIRGVRGVMEQAALHGVEITPHYYTQLVRVSVDRCGVWEAVVWRGMQCDSLAAQRCNCCAATAVLPLLCCHCVTLRHPPPSIYVLPLAGILRGGPLAGGCVRDRRDGGQGGAALRNSVPQHHPLLRSAP